MDYLIDYDRSNPISIETYAQKLIGKSFREVWEADGIRSANVVRETSTYGTAEVSETKRNKGNLGQIIEEKFFHYECNSDSRADFHEAGVFGQRINPCRKRGFASKVLDRVGNLDENVHQNVFCQVSVQQHAEREIQNMGTVVFPELFQGV